jgi:hypothetical protein
LVLPASKTRREIFDSLQMAVLAKSQDTLLIWYPFQDDKIINGMSEVVPPVVDPARAVESPSLPVADSVRSELHRILQSPEFKSSRRCQGFLTFVVEQTLAGHPLKERTIGAEVFGRDASYNTNEDGIVRIRASEVRKRLGLYYATSGKTDEVLIELPVGSYVPTFSLGSREIERSNALLPKALTIAAAPATGWIGQASGVAQSWSIRSKLAVAGALLVTASIVILAGFKIYARATVLDQFWEPVLRSKMPVMVVTAYAPVYFPRDIDAKPNSDFVFLPDQYVGGGDLLAAAKVSGLLSRAGHAYSVRVGNAASFEDLRSAPAVLIGYSSTHWEAVTRGFRFFVNDHDRGVITDNGKPTDWYPHHLGPDFHTDEDYAVVSRAFDPQTHTLIVLVSGCTQYGTDAAAQLITDPALLAEALRGAPAGWQRKNLQLVLHMKVIADSPASPQVIASYYW